MRKDRQLFDAIEADWDKEANESGCCVRLDGSGCVQTVDPVDCPVSCSCCAVYLVTISLYLLVIAL